MAVWRPELTLPIKIGKYDAPQLYFSLQHQQHQSISLAYLLFYSSTIDFLGSFPSRGRKLFARRAAIPITFLLLKRGLSYSISLFHIFVFGLMGCEDR